MRTHISNILVPVFLLLAFGGCRSAETLEKSASRVSSAASTQTHTAMFHVAGWDGWQRSAHIDSVLILDLPEEFGHKAANPSDSTCAHTTTATLASPLHYKTRDASAECSRPTAIKVYGLHLSASSEAQSIVSALTCDSLDSRQSQSVSVSMSKAPDSRAWPLTVAILSVIIATAIWYYSRMRQ